MTRKIARLTRKQKALQERMDAPKPGPSLPKVCHKKLTTPEISTENRIQKESNGVAENLENDDQVMSNVFGSLTDGEAQELAQEFHNITKKYFYGKDLAYESLARAKTSAEQTMRLEDAKAYKRVMHFFLQNFDTIQGPEGPATVASRYGPEAKKLLDSFDKLSHGLGTQSKKVVYEQQIRTMNEYIKAFSDPVTFCKELGRPLPQAARRILRLQGKGYVPPDLQAQEIETSIEQENKKLLSGDEQQNEEATPPKVLESTSCQFKESKSVDENKLPSPDLKLIKSPTPSEQIKQSTNNLSVDNQQIPQVSVGTVVLQMAPRPQTTDTLMTTTAGHCLLQPADPAQLNSLTNSQMTRTSHSLSSTQIRVHKLTTLNYNPTFSSLLTPWWSANIFAADFCRRFDSLVPKTPSFVAIEKKPTAVKEDEAPKSALIPISSVEFGHVTEKTSVPSGDYQQINELTKEISKINIKDNSYLKKATPVSISSKAMPADSTKSRAQAKISVSNKVITTTSKSSLPRSYTVQACDSMTHTSKPRSKPLLYPWLQNGSLPKCTLSFFNFPDAASNHKALSEKCHRSVNVNFNPYRLATPGE